MPPLADLVQVSSSTTRSVNLEADFYREVDLKSYILTSTVQSTLRRIGEGLIKSEGTKAWTLTGPYGSGKSAFCLYLASLFCPSSDRSSSHAIDLLKREAYELWQLLFDGRKNELAGRFKAAPFWPILVTGGRESVHRGLLRGAIRGLSYLSASEHLERAQRIQERMEGEQVNSQEVLTFIEETARDLERKGTISGILVFSDELGKNLEYASLHPDRGDLYILQEFAEKVQRLEIPAILIGMLHQVFDRYADKLTPLERAEWSKVQGRFEDIAFQESTEQLLRLTGRAIRSCPGHLLLPEFQHSAQLLAERAVALGVQLPGLQPEAVVEVLKATFPLHPFTALILGPLFRRLAQNERSLFAFLSSYEPHGFQEFLHRTEVRSGSVPNYGLPELYDYLWSSLGGALLSTPAGRQWALIDTSLSRVDGEDPRLRAALKAIGLFQVAGEAVGFKAEPKSLSFVLGLELGETESILNRLRAQSVITYRAFQGAYAIWEGSDFNLDEELQKARAQIRDDGHLAGYLQELAPARPLIAKRHSLECGTLRRFDVVYADVDKLSDLVNAGRGDADARLFLVFPRDAEEDKRGREILDSDIPDDVVLAIPEVSRALPRLVGDLRALDWMLRTKGELAGDMTARREIHTHLAALQETVRQSLRGVLDAEVPTRWYWNRRQREISNRRKLNEFLSEVCDHVYSLTPWIPNELITRDQLSSSAAAARRNLIEAMLHRSGEENLGIQGHPAERSMYDALLRVTGLHVHANEGWTLVSPSPVSGGFVASIPGERGTSEKARLSLESRRRMANVWATMDSFMDQARAKARPVCELFDTLQQPPIGLKAGPLPVLLCAYMQVHGAAVALYENDTFVPEPTTAHFERLMRAPGKFSVQFCRLDGGWRLVHDALLTSLPGHGLDGVKVNPAGTADLLDIVRPLCQFVARLEVYSKRTSQVGPQAKAVRNAVLMAQDPARLLFEDLPRACGLNPFRVGEPVHADRIEQYVRILGESIQALKKAYPDLLGRLRGSIAEAFRLRFGAEEVRRELRERLGHLTDVPTDTQTLTFLHRATDNQLADREWVESLATFLTTKPPDSWAEHDEALFSANLAQVVRHVNNLEAMVAGLGADVQRGRELKGRLLRLGVMAFGEAERNRVVRVTEEESRKAHQLAKKVVEELGETDADFSLAVLAEAALQILDSDSVPPPAVHRERLHLV